MSARKYVFSLLTGTAINQYADKYTKSKQTPQVDSNHDKSPPSIPDKNDIFTQAIQKLEKRKQTIAHSDPVLQNLKSFNPKNWEVPFASAIERSKKIVQYEYKATTQEKYDDASSAAKEKVKQVSKKILTSPREAIEDTRKAGSVVSGIATRGSKTLTTEMQNYQRLEMSNAARQFGINMMMKAPTYLVPGLMGVAVRAFMNVKTAGNLGRSINDLHKMTGKEDGVIMKTVNKRLEKGAIKPPTDKK